MTRCTGCSRRSDAICTCYADSACYSDPIDYCVESEGNGTSGHPFQFHSTVIPTPRPFGYIKRTTVITNITPGVPVTFDFGGISWPNPGAIAGGMVGTLPTTRLVVPVDGIYIFGGFVDFAGNTNDNTNVTLGINGGTALTGSGVSVSNKISNDTATRPIFAMSIQQFIVGDYLEMFLGVDATQDTVVTDAGFFTHPTLWAMFLGDF